MLPLTICDLRDFIQAAVTSTVVERRGRRIQPSCLRMLELKGGVARSSDVGLILQL